MDGFQLGPIHVYWYSLCLLSAVWLAYFVAWRRRSQVGLSQPELTDLVAVVLVAGVVGGRLGYVLQNLSYFSDHWLDIFYVSSGGMSIHGALIVGALAVFGYAKQHQLSFYKLTDLLVMPVLVGQIVGRLGNYFNQELYGYPTQLPWKIFIDPENRAVPFLSDAYYHPTFLYEMLLNGIGLAILWRLQPKKAGQLTGGYLLVIAISRFIVEIWRISDRPLWNLSTAKMMTINIERLLFITASSTNQSSL